MNVSETIGLLESLRAHEKEQALIYRRLAARAEELGDPALAQRFHDLHADEQHHLSRLTARILELGGQPRDLQAISPGAAENPGDWVSLIHDRERSELSRYDLALHQETDPPTRALLGEIRSVEARHLAELGGKWTMA